MKYFIAIIITLFTACFAGNKKPAGKAVVIISDTIQLPSKAFMVKNGLAFYKDNLFNGTAYERYSSGDIKTSITYKEGKEEGFTYAYYPNKQLEYKRFYTKGEKDSVHTGWWPDGNKRFEYHFNNGVYDGAFKEWYESGNLAKNILYKNGSEVEGKGWRDNGKVYMSFAVKDGRRYGLVNAQLCYSLKNERGEYVESIK